MYDQLIDRLSHRAAYGAWAYLASPRDGEGPLTQDGYRHVTGQWVVDIYTGHDGIPIRADISGYPPGARRWQAKRAVARVLRRVMDALDEY